MKEQCWKASSRAFFDRRAAQVKIPGLKELSYISGRDVRLWSDENLYNDMCESILTQACVDSESSLLEVGCASGFIAKGLAPRLGSYCGLDVAPRAIDLAMQLNLKNAVFRVADGVTLPFVDESYDAAICYDVFTNFPNFEYGESIIREMLRVTKVGGRVMAGSIPDGAKSDQYAICVEKVARDLDARYGKLTNSYASPTVGLLDRFRHWLNPVDPQIVCYDFSKDEFIQLGKELGVKVIIEDIHLKNPYYGYRFNAIFCK